MTFTRSLSTNNFGCAKYIVDGSVTANGTHSTIQAAIDAASAGDTIFIRPKTSGAAYSENLTLKAGVNLTAYGCDGSSNATGNVIISGKATFTGTGTVNISGIQLQTNSDFLLAVTGSSASQVRLLNCYLNCSNNTGISFTSSSASAGIVLNNCNGNLATTGIGFFAHSSSGAISFFGGVWFNTGGSTTDSTCSAGTAGFYNCQFYAKIAISGSGRQDGAYTYFDTSPTNSTPITGAGTLVHCQIISGTASAISCTGTYYIHECAITSTNTNAITGAGTIVYSLITPAGLSSMTAINAGTNTKLQIAPVYLTSLTFDNTSVMSNFVESTWTPTMNTSNSNMTGVTYALQTGRYQRVGNYATVVCIIQWTNTGAGTGNAQGNLPLTPGAFTNGFMRLAPEVQNITFPNTSNYMTVALGANAANWILNGNKTATTTTNLATTTFTNAVVIFTACYYLGT